MKYIIILADGMADEPIDKLGGKTPLEYANTPAMDYLAKNGRLGTLNTIPYGFNPGSEVANLGVLGYDVSTSFEGRGSLEAASMGIGILPGEMAMRCNLICIENGRIKNHSAGHITTEEATQLIEFLQVNLGSNEISFHPGVSYRHLLKINHGNKNIGCTPPHDVPGELISEVLIKPLTIDAQPTANLLNNLIAKSQELLENHPININRQKKGLDKANSIWPWSPGYKPTMSTLSELYGIKNGMVISAVDLIRGIGIYAGLKPIYVEGATGLYNTNYEGKANAAINAINSDCDFVFLHVEASDEAGHEGDIDLKIKTIEYLDSRIVNPILEATKKMSEPITIAVLPDHPTPCRIKTHTSDPVPFLIYNPLAIPDKTTSFSETAAQYGVYGKLNATQFIEKLLK